MTLRLCAYLRWRGFHEAVFPDDAALQAALLRSDRPFSCLHTCRPWGPDDQGTAPEMCQSNRSCFEPSPDDPVHRKLVAHRKLVGRRSS